MLSHSFTGSPASANRLSCPLLPSGSTMTARWMSSCSTAAPSSRRNAASWSAWNRDGRWQAAGAPRPRPLRGLSPHGHVVAPGARTVTRERLTPAHRRSRATGRRVVLGAQRLPQHASWPTRRRRRRWTTRSARRVGAPGSPPQPDRARSSLALALAAAGEAYQPGLEPEEAASGNVIAELARLYLSDVDDPLTRRALEAASVVRRTTEPLLEAMLDDAPGEVLGRRLLRPAVRRRRP